MLKPVPQEELILVQCVWAAIDIVALVVGVTAYCLPHRKTLHRTVYPGLIFFLVLWVPITCGLMRVIGDKDTKIPEVLSMFIISSIYVYFYIHREIDSVSGSPVHRPKGLRVMAKLGKYVLLVDCIGEVSECVGMVWSETSKDGSKKPGIVLSLIGASVSLTIFYSEIGLIAWMRRICHHHKPLEGDDIEASNLRRSHDQSKALIVPSVLTMARLIWRVAEAGLAYGNKHPPRALSYTFDLYFPLVVAIWVPVAITWAEDGLESDTEGAEATQSGVEMANFGDRQEHAVV